MTGTIGPFSGRDLQAQHARGGFAWRRARLGDDDGGGLDRDESGRRVGPFGFDDREGAGGAERFDEVGRRFLGDDDRSDLEATWCARSG